MTLTGIQRIQLTLAWIKRGKDMPREQYIKRVCEAKNIVYVKPLKVDR